MTTYGRRADSYRVDLWGAAVLAVSAPFLCMLCAILWRTPYPVSEAVALFEDVARNPPSRFLNPDTSYYRPLFHMTLSMLWHHAGSLQVALVSIKLLHIVPVSLLVLLFISHIRPQTAIDAAAATLAVAVLVGTAAFRDNLEIPLSYTTVGMPVALLLWMLLERDYRVWQGPAIVALTLIAVGFKEQGLVLVPLVVAAWWTGAPGARRGTAVAVVAVAAVYLAMRLDQSGSWPLFQQEVGFGFSKLSTDEATARFGAFPLWIFAYNGASTVANVLFSEPTAGVFRIVHAISQGRPGPLEIVELISSSALTGLVVWWAVGVLRRPSSREWSPEARLVIGTAVVLAACGILSFDYSRDRLGGMAIVFYALAGFFAVRAAAVRTMQMSPQKFAVAGAALLLLAGGWQLRALSTIEYARETAWKNRREWMTTLQRRRTEFADRPVYLGIMESMIEQGTDASAPEPTRYRRWAVRLLRGR